jgi:hypothetical protein
VQFHSLVPHLDPIKRLLHLPRRAYVGAEGDASRNKLESMVVCPQRRLGSGSHIRRMSTVGFRKLRKQGGQRSEH